MKSVVNYVINLNLMVKRNPAVLMYEVKTKKSSDAKHGLGKETLNTWQR